MYNKVSTDLNFVEREHRVEAFWRENHIFEKSMENRKDAPTYTFYDGPPTANGKPHIGHVLTRVIKDMIPRFQHHEGLRCSRARPAGTPTACRWSWRWKSCWALDGKEQIEAIRSGALH